MAPKILQYFDQDLCDDTINHETIENIDFDEDELLEPSTAQTQTTPPPIPEFVQILVFNKRIPLDANNSYQVIVLRIVRYEEVLGGVSFNGPSFQENDYKKNSTLLRVIQMNEYSLGMSVFISEPRPFTPSTSPTYPNRSNENYTRYDFNAPNTTNRLNASHPSSSKTKKPKKKRSSKSKIAYSERTNKNTFKVKFNSKYLAKTQHFKSKYQCR
jgi:hypothetical protein